MWSDPAQDCPAMAWAAARGDEIAAHANGRVLDNTFGRNLVRLGRVKAHYDPTNLFRLNNNVLPCP
jgi:hypothetical protein